jgi:hypothetical protein
MTHQQYRDYSEPSEPEIDDFPKHGNSWNNDPVLSHFNEIDWREVYDMLKENTIEPGKYHINEFSEENPEERPMIPYNDLRFLADASVIWIGDDQCPMFDVPNDDIPDYNTFMDSVKKARNELNSGTYKQNFNIEPNPERGMFGEKRNLKDFSTFTNENINSRENSLKYVMINQYGYSEKEYKEKFSDYKHYIRKMEGSGHDNDYIARELDELEYGVEFRDMTTAIHNVIYTKNKENAITILDLLEQIEKCEDEGKCEFLWDEINKFDTETHEIDFRRTIEIDKKRYVDDEGCMIINWLIPDIWGA